MFNFSPKNDKFFDLFIDFSELIQEASKELVSFAKDTNTLEERSLKLKDIEHKGDDLAHRIFEELNNNFITPLDREDILVITNRLDDVIDNIEDLAGRYLMYNIKTSREKSFKMIELIDKSAVKLQELFVALKDFKKNNNTKQSIVEINLLETEGDFAYREAMRELFTTDVKEIEIIVWKDLYEKLEKTLDSCETLANLVEGVVMKHV
ncbi:DUF47 domain-containing protein [Clostridium paridis]|uniref:DUF47 domain-containing protein n=1 Tax=Clostridium paridis TaxID=2803863 RepID=A0A937FIY2_9CLOT|nr:DUF47 family protein [Clostridium paridis]MBL4932506.1 DUF47 domain-containing protein [Clostridium paridis]